MKLLKLFVILKDRFYKVKMERKLSVLIAMMLLSVSFELTGALNSDLQLCTSSPQPCIYRQAQSQEVCHGQNASTTMELKLPLDMIQQITVIDIAIKRGTERLIQGLSKNPSYPYLERWEMSHTARGAGSKSGVLTVKVEVLDVQLNDEFESHVEVNVRNQITRTPDEIWFSVMANCSSYNILTDDEGKRTTHNLEPIDHVLIAAGNITSEEDKLKENTIRLHNLESTTSHGFLIVNVIGGLSFALLVIFLLAFIFYKILRKYVCSLKTQISSSCQDQFQTFQKLSSHSSLNGDAIEFQSSHNAPCDGKDNSSHFACDDCKIKIPADGSSDDAYLQSLSDEGNSGDQKGSAGLNDDKDDSSHSLSDDSKTRDQRWLGDHLNLMMTNIIMVILHWGDAGRIE